MSEHGGERQPVSANGERNGERNERHRQDLRVLLVHLGRNTAPQPARVEHVRLVDDGQLAASRLCGLKRELPEDARQQTFKRRVAVDLAASKRESPEHARHAAAPPAPCGPVHW